ncbi:MAG TPA: hypothetical protein VMN99_06470 [Anaerolineales bacterium]|nr:hypothetical protein [Anaerolineales bacterium]
METKATHTLEELKDAAAEQKVRIEEKAGKYRIVRTLSERFGLVVVKAGDGYSLDHDGMREFLIFNSVDIGERITGWSKKHERNLHPQTGNGKARAIISLRLR